MGLIDKIKGEFIDIIEWLDPSRDTIVWRFPRYDNEIKMGAKLTVRESQVADAYPPGMYELQTQNMPILSTLKGWKYGFHSPFKAEVYFINTRQFTDMKWGTANPVIVRDPEFGMVRLRAFGAYSMRVIDPRKLLAELVGTDPMFRTEEVEEYLRQMIVGRLGNALATAEVPMLDLAAHQQNIGERLAQVLTGDLADVGIAIPRFIIENISVPPEVEAALDKRTQMGVLGNLDQYTKFQTANAIEQAAQNPGGGAGASFGLGLGMAAGQQAAATMSQQFQQQPQQQQPAAAQQPPAGPPPLPAQRQWYLGVGGAQQGPFDQAGLSAAVANGTLRPDTLVWSSGMGQWTPASQVPEVSAVLSSAPPPLPPQ